jgi:hypothetical protein
MTGHRVLRRLGPAAAAWPPASMPRGTPFDDSSAGSVFTPRQYTTQPVGAGNSATGRHLSTPPAGCTSWASPRIRRPAGSPSRPGTW